MKVLLVWSGGVVPAYRDFFSELGGYCELRVLTPGQWVHGSKPFRADAPPKTENFKLIPVRYFRLGSSAYVIPAFIPSMLVFRPDRVYFMDEMDRPATFFHLTLSRWLRPSARRIIYALQNISKPAYAGIFQALFTRLNRSLVNAAITATRESESVLRASGFRKPVVRIPLFASAAQFRPLPPEEKIATRRRLGIPDNRYVVMHSGSLGKAKGVDLLIRLAPRHPHLFFIFAGQGEMETAAKALPSTVGRYLGALELAPLREAYQSADAVILASRDTLWWKEQVGRSLLEGILCGCLGLGSSSGSIPEVLATPETVFPQGDEKALDALLARLPLADSERLREAQHQRVLREYSATAVALATANFLESA